MLGARELSGLMEGEQGCLKCAGREGGGGCFREEGQPLGAPTHPSGIGKVGYGHASGARMSWWGEEMIPQHQHCFTTSSLSRCCHRSPLKRLVRAQGKSALGAERHIGMGLLSAGDAEMGREICLLWRGRSSGSTALQQFSKEELSWRQADCA